MNVTIPTIKESIALKLQKIEDVYKLTLQSHLSRSAAQYIGHLPTK